ncbi:putative methyltransferase C9orf114 homolog isoform X2 [Antennarius striatus]|uniref:putative methyltransferase C9orf114 homolog isoform X2 n=1 Tax=Antennarius striatus TaxID=241820 RepID=UPI0035B31B41
MSCPGKKPRPASSQPEERVDWKRRRAGSKVAQKQRKEAKLIRQLEQHHQQGAVERETGEPQKRHSTEGRGYTVSVALPGSVLDNAQSLELRSYLAGQIARACVVFCVDEIVVFDEGGDVTSVDGEFRGVGKKGHACVQLARILQYLECPQYLRKCFFPKHQDLQYAGLLNPLDSPHHMRMDDESDFREGVVLDRPSRPGQGSLVNCGMRKEVRIDKQLQAGLRVTVQLLRAEPPDRKRIRGVVVSPQAPRSRRGLYWGYSVRLAACLSAVFSESPYQDGYDLTVGTSERGSSVDRVGLEPFRHLLVVFGGLRGLEASVDADPNLDVSDPRLLFDLYLNTCPGQGSRTIRTEVGATLVSTDAQVVVGSPVSLLSPCAGGHPGFHGDSKTEDHGCLHGHVQRGHGELLTH